MSPGRHDDDPNVSEPVTAQPRRIAGVNDFLRRRFPMNLPAPRRIALLEASKEKTSDLTQLLLIVSGPDRPVKRKLLGGNGWARQETGLPGIQAVEVQRHATS